MRIARTAATLFLVLAAVGCGNTPTEPGGNRGRPEPAGTEAVSPGSAAPLRSGNMMGSGH